VIPATELLTVFVNGRLLGVQPGATGSDAVRALDLDLARELDAGRAYLTDARGIRIGAAEHLVAGDILRVVMSARQTRDSDADA